MVKQPSGQKLQTKCLPPCPSRVLIRPNKMVGLKGTLWCYCDVMQYLSCEYCIDFTERPYRFYMGAKKRICTRKNENDVLLNWHKAKPSRRVCQLSNIIYYSTHLLSHCFYCLLFYLKRSQETRTNKPARKRVKTHQAPNDSKALYIFTQ